MKQFKKRTLALVLASAMTVVGSFAAEKYTNSLMSFKIKPKVNSILVILETKTIYQEAITPSRKDANTFILMMPNTDNQASIPNINELGGLVESINVSTRPYTKNSNGYTKIVIKTAPNININTITSVYVPGENKNLIEDRSRSQAREDALRERKEAEAQRAQAAAEAAEKARKEAERIAREEALRKQLREQREKEEQQKIMAETTLPEAKSTAPKVETPAAEEPQNEKIMLILGILLIIAVSAFLYTKSKTKINEIIGERSQIDIDDKDEPPAPKKKTKKTKIQSVIKDLDQAYSNTALSGISAMNSVSSAPIKTETVSEELNVVDLDEIMQNTPSYEEDSDTNDALEDFLNDFDFDEEPEAPAPEEPPFDEELYQKIINGNYTFNKNDLECIKQILSIEISDDTLKNIEEFAPRTPVVPDKNKVLEDFITTYAVSQNIKFTQEDIDALYKLISVEIDPEFITDLSTNPELTKAMEKAIAARKETPVEKSQEISTLKVKDLLPDLSKEINKKEAYRPKPSSVVDLVASGYEFQKLSVADQLPDLQDMLAHPEKYETKKEEPVIADEEAMLKSIANVQFKPFDDGTREFEILNTAEDIEAIQKEFSQFENFEIAIEEDYSVADEKPNEKYGNLQDEDYLDLDKAPESFREDDLLKQHVPDDEEDEVAEEDDDDEISEEAQAQDDSSVAEARHIRSTAPAQEFKCILEGVTYNILSEIKLTDNVGCYLGENDNGFTVLGYVDEEIKVLRTYNDLRITKMQARLNDKLPDGIYRYIIRLGMTKFIVEVTAESIVYVMDL